MKTKALSLTLAGLMSIQSAGFAQQTNRTDGVGDQAITSAKNNLQSLNHEILLLDQALSKAAESITQRDSQGGITNGIAVAGAGLGLGISAMAFLTLNKRSEGAGLEALLLGTGSIIATVASMTHGGISQLLKSNANTAELEAQLAQAQKNVEVAMVQSTDKATTAALTQMGVSIKNTLAAVNSYQAQETEVSRNRLVSQASQLAGTALLVFGMRQQATNTPMLGMLIMNVGNLGALISGFQGSEAQAILKEIAQTRESLKILSASLQ